MRKELVIFTVIIAVVLVLGLFGRSLILNIAVSQIKSAFPGYDVSIGSAEVRNADMLAITDIVVKKNDAIRYKIKSAEINFSPLSLFTRTVPKITIKNGSLEFSSRDKKLKEILEYPTLKPDKGFIARSIVISNLIVVVSTADWQLTAGTDGNIEMRKRPAGETEIEGDFSTVPGGGKLAIKDEEFLKRLAEKTKRPLAVIEDLKDYDYTKCNLQISGKPESISLHVILDGPKGKKDLTFPLRGF